MASSSGARVGGVQQPNLGGASRTRDLRRCAAVTSAAVGGASAAVAGSQWAVGGGRWGVGGGRCGEGKGGVLGRDRRIRKKIRRSEGGGGGLGGGLGRLRG
jgi:hypothetical protein